MHSNLLYFTYPHIILQKFPKDWYKTSKIGTNYMIIYYYFLLLVQLSTCRDSVIYHQKVQSFVTVFRVYC